MIPYTFFYQKKKFLEKGHIKKTNKFVVVIIAFKLIVTKCLISWVYKVFTPYFYLYENKIVWLKL